LRLLAATNNKGKAREIQRLLAEDKATQGWEVISLSDLAYLWRNEEIGGLPPLIGGDAQVDIEIRKRYDRLTELMEETGTTFEENAGIKALGAARFTGIHALADDSGLEVDWLGGAPGVYSARYAGPRGDEATRNSLLLTNMAGAAEGRRDARFVSVLVFASPEGIIHRTYGICEGRIGFAPRGEGGFGFDPLFIPLGSDRTMAEMTMEEKNKISHRGIALARMQPT
jgi:non-canonical purine NTP pyrophosphatase (RdgB/HAM1 family)